MRKTKAYIAASLACMVPVLLSGCAALTSPDANVLKASGVVEMMEVAVSSELGGQVLEVYVEQGARVQSGEALFRLDDEQLRLERDQVQAGGESSVVAAELALLQARQELSELNENWPLLAAQYQLEVAQAREALKDARYRQTVRQQGNRASSNTILAAEANLILAEEEVDRAQRALDLASGEASKALARSNLAAARQLRDSIQRNLNWYYGSPTEIEQALLNADVAIAEARLAEAEQEFAKWRSGPDRDQLALARAAIANAEALLELARVQARSQLRGIDLALEDSVIQAPVDAVVLLQSVEAGELIAPGVPVMILGVPDRMTITVYLAENQYGKVSVGDMASVSVDSFPGEVFEARVTRIADQAEYTPRNVQTVEERQTTVYAVELRLVDPSGHLKAGMPADVIFLPVGEA